MASAIELYKQAYDADYNQGDRQYAAELYQRIIEEFPYSDEKEYALVHLERLQKLAADPHDPRFMPASGQGAAAGLTVLNFVLLLLLLAGGAFLGYFQWMQRQKLAYTDLIIEGMACEKTGDVKGAEIRLKLANKTLPQEPLAYRFLAELYLEGRQFELARIERNAWTLAAPSDPGIADFSRRLDLAVKTGGDK